MAEAGAGRPGRELRRLCRLYGVVPQDRRAGASSPVDPGVLRAVLRARGAPVEGPADVPDALRARERARRSRVCPPVLVAWAGRPDPLVLRLAGGDVPERLSGELVLEDGERRRFTLAGDRLRPTATRTAGGERRVRVVARLPGPVPPGYHRLELTVHGRPRRIFLVSAPRRAWPSVPGEAGEPPPREWGVFLPLYGLRDDPDLGVGDLGGLRRLAEWARDRGADWVATLPLLPQFLDRPVEPSPYAPVSRLFWNELYLDAGAAAEACGAGGLPELLERAGERDRARELAGTDRVDYRAAGRLKRALLEALLPRARDAGLLPPAAGEADGAGTAGRRGGDGGADDAEAYARFRAACERKGGGPSAWGRDPGPGELVAGRDYDPEVRNRHLLAQRLLDRQMEAVDRATTGEGGGLYLDLPLSSHPDGYDVWRHRELFGTGASLGAPPDAFFQEGQDWGFPPQDPGRMRRTGYRYFRACLSHHMRHASVLRVDHVMRAHRLYWIPEASDARHGAYVRYPAREMYAILSLESHRHRTALLGEDLGTVPGAVRQAMERHGLRRSWVLPFELDAGREPPLDPPPEESVASLNTHDMWPFAAWWTGEDIDERAADGDLGPGEARRARDRRTREREALTEHLRRRGRWSGEGVPPPRAALGACLEEVAASDARGLLVNLEDLWLETRPPNFPGRPGRSWRRRARFTLEELRDSGTAAEILHRVDRARRRGPTASADHG